MVGWACFGTFNRVPPAAGNNSLGMDNLWLYPICIPLTAYFVACRLAKEPNP